MAVLRDERSRPTVPLRNNALTCSDHAWRRVSAMITIAAFAILRRPRRIFVWVPGRGCWASCCRSCWRPSSKAACSGWSGSRPSSRTASRRYLDRLQAIFGEGWIGAVGPVAAALIGALMAALMSAFTDPKKVSLLTADGCSAGKDGRHASRAWSRTAPSTPRPRAGSTRSWALSPCAISPFPAQPRRLPRETSVSGKIDAHAK